MDRKLALKSHYLSCSGQLAQSGMPRRNKEHVMRIYEKLYIEGQLDLFG